MLQKIVDASDNPMSSEISGHIGGKGNFPCRKCKVGGTQAEKREDQGYHALFEVILLKFYLWRIKLLIPLQEGEPRSKSSVLAELHRQVQLACSGVGAAVKSAQTGTGVKDTYTQVWINKLIARFQAMSADRANPKSTKEIEAELIQWTLDNEDIIYSDYLTTEGRVLYI